jgi:hypothetical protein
MKSVEERGHFEDVDIYELLPKRLKHQNIQDDNFACGSVWV